LRQPQFLFYGSIDKILAIKFKYRINFKDHRDDNQGISRKIETGLIILAAGTLGSTEILSRSKSQKKLQISNTLGTHFSTNGDTFGVIHPSLF